MKLFRRMIVVMLATVTAVSPALACAGVCPDVSHHATVQETAAGPSHAGHTTVKSQADCIDHGASSSHMRTLAHGQYCASMPGCAEKTSFKNQALSSAAAISIAAPAIVFISGSVSAKDVVSTLPRRFATPFAAAPPPAFTLLYLKTLLRF